MISTKLHSDILDGINNTVGPGQSHPVVFDLYDPFRLVGCDNVGAV
jgi:hypothetical protein